MPDSEAAIDPADRGLLLGDGLFETLRSYRGSVACLARHLARLRDGAGVLGIPFPEFDLRQAVHELLAANRLQEEDAAIRITLTRGPGPRGLAPPEDPQPTTLITAARLVPQPDSPATAILAPIRRNEHSPLARLKTLNYLDNLLAHKAAAERGADEAILLNTVGRLASASAANLFLVHQKSLLTPPPSEGLLPGIIRALVFELAPQLGLTVVEAPLAPADLDRVDEAFLTNSLIEVRALHSLDGRPIGDGGLGPMTRRIQQALRDRILDEG